MFHLQPTRQGLRKPRLPSMQPSPNNCADLESFLFWPHGSTVHVAILSTFSAIISVQSLVALCTNEAEFNQDYCSTVNFLHYL